MIIVDGGLKTLYLTLLAFASNNEEQLAFTNPGCVYCDLIEDFDSCINFWLKDYPFSQNQNIILKDIEKAIDLFISKKYPCYEIEFQNSNEWISIRNKSIEALNIFNIVVKKIPKSIEVGRNIWNVDTNEFQIETYDK